MITASDWRPLQRNPLLGFLTLTLVPSGIVLHDCGLHQKDGRRWIALPSKPQIDSKGRHSKGETGKGLYTPIVAEIAGKEERAQFQAALAAVDRLLAADEPTNPAKRGFGRPESPDRGLPRRSATRPARHAGAPLLDDRTDDVWSEGQP
jgi:hypothetical protein